MRITADISYYPLDAEFPAPIKAFIARLKNVDGLELATNRMSTQVRGEFSTVTDAIAAAMREHFAADGTHVVVVKYINADLDIG